MRRLVSWGTVSIWRVTVSISAAPCRSSGSSMAIEIRDIPPKNGSISAV